jgi:hypothetical protein
MAGVPVENSKLHANWSLNNSTFEDCYYRPGDQHIRGTKIVDTVFGSATKKITTSEVGLEATVIVVDTTHNSFFHSIKKTGASCWCAELYSLILIKYSVRSSDTTRTRKSTGWPMLRPLPMLSLYNFTLPKSLHNLMLFSSLSLI